MRNSGPMLPYAAATLVLALFGSDALAQVKLRRPIPLGQDHTDDLPPTGFPTLRVRLASFPDEIAPRRTVLSDICFGWKLDTEAGCGPSCCDGLYRWIASGQAHLCSDVQHFYGCSRILCHTTALATAAALAHTDADQSVRNWYQRDVRNARTDHWAKMGKNFGELWTLGVYSGALVVGKITEDTWCGAVTYDWANRSIRSLIIGAPVVGVLQRGLGSSRPWENQGSRWRPIEDDSGASGHAFLGAVPFLTAASMTENRLLRGSLVLASTWTAWSRINDDEHYLSQAVLGWYVAYQAVQSVNCTQCAERRVRLLPYFHPEGSGLAVHIEY